MGTASRTMPSFIQRRQSWQMRLRASVWGQSFGAASGMTWAPRPWEADDLPPTVTVGVPRKDQIARTQPPLNGPGLAGAGGASPWYTWACPRWML